MKKLLFTISIYLLSGLTTIALSDETIGNESALGFDASYIGDNVINMSGGIKTGYNYLGMANLRLTFDTEKAGLWKGAMFYINAANTHGGTPSANLIGDNQVVSNIEAGNHTFLQEVIFQQKIGNLDITAGLQDLNVQFANTESGSVYLNSSFGILPVISANTSAPIFPLTSFGLTVKWNISESTSWINAIHDGSPTDFSSNPYNLHWHFHSGDGILAISEFQHLTKLFELPGTYKLGFFTLNHFVENTFIRPVPDSINIPVNGIYTHSDQQIWQRGNRSLNIFSQLGYSPSKGSINNYYLGLGLNLTGALSSKGRDILGLAMAHEHFTNGLSSETAIELTYRYQITDCLYIQPDLQYIINPAGTGIILENCLAGSIRFGITL